MQSEFLFAWNISNLKTYLSVFNSWFSIDLVMKLIQIINQIKEYDIHVRMRKIIEDN